MTNPQKAAIEEAAKLPTAYQSAQEHNAVDKYGKPQSEVLAAIESHTAAHTTTLRERVKELEAQNDSYRKALEDVIIRLEEDKRFHALSIAKEALKQEEQ